MYFFQYLHYNKYLHKPYGCMYLVRAQISDMNVQRLEEATGTKITKNCDQAIRHVLDKLDSFEQGQREKACWVESDSLTEQEKEDGKA